MAQSTSNPEEVIFKAAIQLEAPADREAYVLEACGGDRELFSGVQLLLQHHDTNSFLDGPVLDPSVTFEESPISEGPGTIIGRYKLLERIGEGGMAVVYMAEQAEPIRRKVALKIIKLGMDTKQVIARFEAERQALAMMDHPNIAKVLDAGATETGRPYFVMELVQGVSVTEYCDKNNLTTKQRLGLFIQVCNAVQHAHQKGIIHRDLKPSNVMVTHHDGIPVPKVIDFGIAKATNQRLTEKTLFTRYAHIIGTPAYMSPEQAELSDLDIDTRSDIYSLGVLLYELLTGTPPFSEEELRKAGYLEMQRRIREEEPAKPSTKLSTLGETLTEVAKHRSATPDLLRKAVRGDLDWIVMKSLEKDRGQRYDSASALLEDIRRHLSQEPVLAGPPAVWYRTSKFVRRHGKLVATLGVVTVVVVAGFIVSTAMYLRAEQARKEATMARTETQSVADFLTNDLLASVYPERAKGQAVTVQYILDSASTHLERKFGSSPLAEAKVRDALGLTYQKMGKYHEAEPHLRRALAVRRAQLGADHPVTLSSLDRLGWLYWYQGRYEEGRLLVAEALEARQDVLGPEHADTLESMTHLAWLERRETERIALAEKAYQTARRTLGQDHPITLVAATCLTMRYVAHGRQVEAEAIAPPTYELSRRVLGEEHESTLALMNALVWLYEIQGRSAAGLVLAERALDVAQRALGEEHMVTLHAMGNLGSLYLRQGRYEEAAPLLVRSVELARRCFAEDGAITVCCALKLAALYYAQDRYDEHDTLLIELLQICRRTYDEDSVLTRSAKYGLEVRMKRLSKQATEGNASIERESAAARQSRLETIRQALNGDADTCMEPSNE